MLGPKRGAQACLQQVWNATCEDQLNGKRVIGVRVRDRQGVSHKVRNNMYEVEFIASGCTGDMVHEVMFCMKLPAPRPEPRKRERVHVIMLP